MEWHFGGEENPLVKEASDVAFGGSLTGLKEHGEPDRLEKKPDGHFDNWRI